jgi:aryl-alcohol dehydrogenase-like predicted oxidoreductase
MLARSLGVSERDGRHRFASVQPRYNLLYRQIEHELLPLCAAEGIAVIPYNPLAGGILSGKHVHDAGPASDTRFAITGAGERYQERYWQLAEFAAVDALRPVAAEAGMSLVTLAVAWMLAQPAVTSPIIGVSRPEHLDDNVAALEVVLDADLLARLDELTHDFRLTEPVVWGRT